jgi:hypothetical protein
MSAATGDPNKAVARPQVDEDADDEPVSTAKSAPATAAPAASTANGDNSSRAQDILAMIRNRKQ